MNVTVELLRRIAVVTVDRPPVNALSNELRAKIYEALCEVELDERVEGIVLACAGRTFIAGADIAELGKSVFPTFRDLIDKLEGMSKPSLAAIHGTALGGGFELALACRLRSALKGSKIGFPEVKLGLLPGAGGERYAPPI